MMYIPLWLIQVYLGIAIVIFVISTVICYWSELPDDDYASAVFFSFLGAINWFWTLLAFLVMFLYFMIRDNVLRK